MEHVLDEKLIEIETALNEERLPGDFIAMVSERVYAMLYKGEVYMLYDPLDGFYVLLDDCDTLSEYIDLGFIEATTTEEYIEQCCEVYDERLLQEYLDNHVTV